MTDKNETIVPFPDHLKNLRFKANIRKWGNSYIIVIPKSLFDANVLHSDKLYQWAIVGEVKSDQKPKKEVSN